MFGHILGDFLTNESGHPACLRRWRYLAWKVSLETFMIYASRLMIDQGTKVSPIIQNRFLVLRQFPEWLFPEIPLNDGSPNNFSPRGIFPEQCF
jgi:hypothetical protein